MAVYTFEATTELYKKTKRYLGLDNSTHRVYNNGIDTLDDFFKGDDIREITRPRIIDMRDTLYDQPGKLKVALAVLNNILGLAYDKGWVEYNHARQIGGLPPSVPWKRWLDDEFTAFVASAPSRLVDVVILALYTGQRQSDLCRIRWSDYHGDSIHVVQEKTGAELDIPVHPRLREHIDGMPCRGIYLLNNAYDQRWVPDSMRRAVRNHANSIGLVDLKFHGLRKATGTILAELGCTPHEIMAILGHKTLKEAERYTREAGKAKLAKSAMSKWVKSHETTTVG